MKSSRNSVAHIENRMVLRFFFLFLILQSLSVNSQEIVPKDVTLDQYLHFYGYNLLPEGSGSKDNYFIEGFSTDAQRGQFVELMKLYPHITDVLEIGLNGGHSAECFLNQSPNVKRLVSIDINWHPYTKHAVQYLMSKYQERFMFISGDSIVKIPELGKLNAELKFDLILIDGNHNYNYCLLDILNSRSLARSKAIILIDDYDSPSVQQVVHKCQEMKIIEVHRVWNSQDAHGYRSWVEARYLER